MSVTEKNTGRPRGYNDERGSALVYILIAIALLAALTVAFMRPSDRQTQSQGTFKSVSQMTSQIEFIRSAVQECMLVYPQGDKAAMDDGAQVNNPYPLMPDSSYFSAYCSAEGSKSDHFVNDLRCPGKPGNDDPCHATIFSGATNKFLPPPPDLFSDWRYYNGNDGVFIWTVWPGCRIPLPSGKCSGRWFHLPRWDW